MGRSGLFAEECELRHGFLVGEMTGLRVEDLVCVDVRVHVDFCAVGNGCCILRMR